MIELTFLALLHRLMNWGVTPLIATRTVAADAAALHRFLCDPANQPRLLGGRPRGLAARTRAAASGRVITVELVRGDRTLLWLTWILSPGRGTTEVDLAVQFETRGLATRLALVLGGRRWLAHRIDAALGRLGRMCARAAEEVVPAAAPPECGGRGHTTRPARGPNRAAARKA